MKEAKEAKFEYKLGQEVLVRARIIAVQQIIDHDPLYTVEIMNGEPEGSDEVFLFCEKELKRVNG